MHKLSNLCIAKAKYFFIRFFIYCYFLVHCFLFCVNFLFSAEFPCYLLIFLSTCNTNLQVLLFGYKSFTSSLFSAYIVIIARNYYGKKTYRSLITPTK